MKTSDHRKHIPVGVKLHACLLLLGFTEDEISGGIQWDHYPALNLRVLDPETGMLTPHPNDPAYLRPLRTDDHKVKTFGRGGARRTTTRDSDLSEPRRIDKISTKHQEFRNRLLAPKVPKADRPKSKWPRRKFGA
jgi:hypothetical protein